MSVNNFEEFAENIEIMQIIFELLNFEEQLKLAQVSQHLKYIFTNFVWKVNYEKICIIKHPTGFYIENETKLNALKLTANEFKEFLNVYSSDIKELEEIRGPMLDIRKFPNLTSLGYYDMLVDKFDFENVADHCQNLEQLTVHSCQNRNDGLLKLGRDLEINTLLKIKELKYLNVDSFKEEYLSYKDFLDLVTKTKIKHLILGYAIEAENACDLSERDTTNSLEELRISGATIFEKRNFSSCLTHFANLYSLALDYCGCINNSTIEILAKTCGKLKVLQLNNSTFRVDNFNLLTSVENFTIHYGNGLSHKNLRQILTEMQLLSYTSRCSDYEGEFENFIISSTVESLNIYGFSTYKFKGAYEGNYSIKQLYWYDDYNKEPLRELSSFKCPNLERLDIVNGFIPLECLLQLKSLVKLSLKFSFKHFDWNCIMTLLKNHASLREFELKFTYEDQQEDSPPKEAFECAENLKIVTISLDIFQKSYNFWMDLLDKNRHLKIICEEFDFDVMSDKLNDLKLPSFLRIIYINGFKVYVKNLKKDCHGTITKIINDSKVAQWVLPRTAPGIIFN